jgi:transposase-like protein
MGTSPVDDIDRRRRNRPLAAWRKARAVELAIEGRTYGEIATEVGYANRGTAYRHQIRFRRWSWCSSTRP